MNDKQIVQIILSYKEREGITEEHIEQAKKHYLGTEISEEILRQELSNAYTKIHKEFIERCEYQSFVDNKINLVNKATLDVYEQYGIIDISTLSDFMDKRFEYGGFVNIDGTLYALPYGLVENNRLIRYDHPCVKAFYQKYFYEQLHGKGYKALIDELWRIEEQVLQRNYWVMPCVNESCLASPIGGCWDQAEFAGDFLEKKGYEVKRLAFFDKNYPFRFHAFIVYPTENGKWYYFENADLELRGIHEFESYDELIRAVRVAFLSSRQQEAGDEFYPGRYEMYEYKKPKSGCSAEDLLHLVLSGKKLT